MAKIQLSGNVARATCAKLLSDARESRVVSRMETHGLAYCMAENIATDSRARGDWNQARVMNAIAKALAPLYLN